MTKPILWKYDSVAEMLAAKKGGHFTIEKWGTRWAINIHRVDCPVETVFAGTSGEANRIRLELGDEGLAGYVSWGA